MDEDPAESSQGSGKIELRKVFTLTQYNRSVERLLKTQVPKVWVKGVITQLNVRGKLAYLTLGEFEADDARPRAVLETTLWTSQLEVMNMRFAQLPTPLALRVELKVALLVEANFYVPSGRFQPRVLDIDENFTIGELSLTRQRTLERLMREGLLNRNKQRTLPDAPLRVGLITAPGSAAYQDFITTLLNSGFSFRVAFAGAKMQGDAAEKTVLTALERLSSLKLDVICLVRGGGSKTDLVYFDAESICRGIAQCPVPVLTGIGHEIDNSLADLVAFADKITPTDCAKFLVERLSECWSRLGEATQTISETWQLALQECVHDLGQKAATFRHIWSGRKSLESAHARERADRLAGSTRQILKMEKIRLAADRTGLLRGPDKILGLEKLRFQNRTQGLAHAWDKSGTKSTHLLQAGFVRLRDRVSNRLAEQKQGLDLKGRLVHAADPARQLALGFAMLRNPEGKILTRTDQVPSGMEIVTQLQDGYITSQVLSKRKNP